MKISHRFRYCSGSVRFDTGLKVLRSRSEEQKIRNWNFWRLEYLLKWPTLQRVVLLLQLEFPFWWFPFSFFFSNSMSKKILLIIFLISTRNSKKRFTWNSSKVRHCQIGKIGKLGSCQASSLVPPQQGITKVPVRSQHGIIRLIFRHIITIKSFKMSHFYDSSFLRILVEHLCGTV